MIRPVVSLITGLLCALLLTLPARGQDADGTMRLELFLAAEKGSTEPTIIPPLACLVGIVKEGGNDALKNLVCRYTKDALYYRDKLPDDVTKNGNLGVRPIDATESIVYGSDENKIKFLNYIFAKTDVTISEQNESLVTIANRFFNTADFKVDENSTWNGTAVKCTGKSEVDKLTKIVNGIVIQANLSKRTTEITNEIHKIFFPNSSSCHLADFEKNYLEILGNFQVCNGKTSEGEKHVCMIQEIASLKADKAKLSALSTKVQETAQISSKNAFNCDVVEVGEENCKALGGIVDKITQPSSSGVKASSNSSGSGILEDNILVIAMLISILILTGILTVLLVRRLQIKASQAGSKPRPEPGSGQSPTPQNSKSQAEKIFDVLTQIPLVQSSIMENGTIYPQALNTELNRWAEDVLALAPLRKRQGRTINRDKDAVQQFISRLSEQIPQGSFAKWSEELDSRLSAIKEIEKINYNEKSKTFEQKVKLLSWSLDLLKKIAETMEEQSNDFLRDENYLQDRVKDLIRDRNEYLRKLEYLRSSLQFKLLSPDSQPLFPGSVQRPADWNLISQVDRDLISQVEKVVNKRDELQRQSKALIADLEERERTDEHRETTERQWNDSVAQVVQDWMFLPIPPAGEAKDAGPQNDHPVRAAIDRLKNCPKIAREVWLQALGVAMGWQGVRRRLQSPDHLELFEELGIDGTVEELKKIIQRIDSFGRPYRADQIGMEFWEHVLLPCFVSGWAHRLLRADLLLRTYYADDADIGELRNMVSVIAALFRRLSKDAGVELHLGRLLEPHNGSTKQSSEHPTERFRRLPPVRAVVLQLIEEGRLDTVIDMSQVGFNCDSERLDLKVRLINRSEWVS